MVKVVVVVVALLAAMVLTVYAENANWSRVETGDASRKNCAGLDQKNFGPCPGYYVWTKYLAGGAGRVDHQAPGDGPSVSAPSAPAAPAAAPSHGGHGGGHGKGR